MGRILYVEDDLRDYEAYADELEMDHSWEIERASGPLEAIEKLNRQHFDVVLIDRRMRDPTTGEMRMVGDDLVEQIAALWPYMCLIVLTHFGDVEAAQAATRHGAYRYFVKGVDVATLDRACRKGLKWQMIRRVRHHLLRMVSVEEIISETKRLTVEIFEPPGYCFAYLPLGPGGALMVGDCDCKVESGAVAEELRGASPFMHKFLSARQVLESRQFSLRTSRAEISAEKGTLIESPGSQLIVPVLQSGDDSGTQRTMVTALLWIESLEEKAFDRDDAEILSELADYVGLAFAMKRECKNGGLAARRDERQTLLGELAHRVRNPLQTVQSTIDMLAARVNAGGDVSDEPLKNELAKALDGIERSIQELGQLDAIARRRNIALSAVDIASLIESILGAFEARAKANACEIRKDFDDAVPHVLLDPAEMRYIVGCLLDNALEAIQRKRASTNGSPETGEIIVRLKSDPDRKESVLLQIEDNGCGILTEDLANVFERHFSTKTKDVPRGDEGVGLWEAKRFVHAVRGEIDAKSSPRGGALLRVLLPACEDDAPPERVTLD